VHKKTAEKQLQINDQNAISYYHTESHYLATHYFSDRLEKD